MVGKVATLGGLVVVGGAALGLMVSAWLSVFAGFSVAGVAPDLSFLAVRGPAPAGWWLFAFAVGVAAGAVVRRTLGAIVITFAVVIVVLALSNLLVAALAEPQLTVAAALPMTDAVPPDSVISSYTWIDPTGSPKTEEEIASMTPNRCGPQDELAFQQCLYDLGYRAEVGYVTSAARWQIDWIPLILLVGASLMLLFGATWRVERAPA